MTDTKLAPHIGVQDVAMIDRRSGESHRVRIIYDLDDAFERPMNTDRTVWATLRGMGLHPGDAIDGEEGLAV